ncbi:MAG: hypothetical protein MRY83_10205, partial [Flavobacteriales bacterium]|nr:hypothetical protein [Flavobacteriales bacterium]
MVIQSQIGNDITVCLDTFELVITLDNPSPFLLEDINCEVRLPSGFVYIPGSVTGGAESNISVQNKPIFSMADMPTLTYNKQLTLKGYATCNFIGQYAQGFALSDTVLVSYTKGGSPDQEPLHFTPSFFVRIPSLNISTITPQSFNANSTPDTFQRCIVITNTGDGSLRSFDFTEDHGTSIDVLSFDIGNWNSSGTLESLYLSGVDFSAFGNGDVLFDPGESITICQDVAITDCQSLYSDYEAFWGCHSQICEVANQNANVVFPNITPNIQITAYDTVKTCYGHTLPNEQRLVITNTGLGKAKDIELYIMMSWSTGVQNGIQSYFDAASFSLKDMNGANINFVQTDSTFSSVPCVPFGQPSSVMIRIDSLNSGDSLELTWEILNCCLNTLNGWRDIAAWSYTATYFNECGNDFIVPLSQGTPRTHVGTTISVNNTPGSIISGQNYMFDFLLDSYSNSFPKGNGFHWKYVFDLSPCVSLVGNNVSILSEDLVQTWNPSSVTVNGNQVIALFNGNPPFSLNKALLNIELTPNCGACASNSANISVSSFYISDLSCNCEVAVNTASLQTNIVCPQYNCLGMTNFPFQVQRTSYGSPDNDNDGLADAGGTLNFSKIRTDRVTLGDTITSIFKGKVNTSPPFIPNFNYCYAEAIIDNGAYFSGVSSVLEIYRGGNLLAVCNNLNLTSSNVVSTNKTRFVYDATASV